MAQDLLAYDDRGSGRPVVLIHGLTFNRRSWEPIAHRLAERHRVISLDLPGHGQSTGSAANGVALTQRIVTTLGTLDVQRPVVVGHSAGALHATALASMAATSGVINVDQPLVVAPFAALLHRMAPALQGPDFASAFAPFEQSIGVDALPEPERSRLAGTRKVDQEVVLDHWSMPMTRSPQDAQAMVDQMLTGVTVPYLYLAGDPLPEALRQYLEKHIQSVDIVLWPGHGHLPHHADMDRFVELVTGFVARCPTR